MIQRKAEKWGVNDDSPIETIKKEAYKKGFNAGKKYIKEELILEQACCNIARQKGLVAVKLEKNKHKGIPDYMFIQEGGKCLFVEFKRPDGTGVVSDEQRFWAKFLGYSHRFIDNLEEFEHVIGWYFDHTKHTISIPQFTKDRKVIGDTC